MKTVQISQSQIVMITFMFGYSSNSFLFSPLIKLADYSSWFIFLLSYVIAVVLLVIVTKMGQKINKYSFLTHGDEIVGKWIHSLVLVYLFMFTLHLTAFQVRLFTEFLVGTYFPTTPEEVLIFLFCFLCFTGAYAGIETIGRLAQYFAFLCMLIAFTVPIFLLKDLDYDVTIALINRFNLLQVWEGTIYTIPWFVDIVIIILVFHMIASPEKTGKSLAFGVGLHVITYLPLLILVLMVLGPYFPTESAMAEHELLRHIRFANFMENMDAFYISIWMVAIFIKVSFCLFVYTIVFTKLVKLKDYKKTAPIMGLLLFGYTIHISENSSETMQFVQDGFSAFVWTVVAIPILYLIVAKIRGKKTDNHSNSKKASSDA